MSPQTQELSLITQAVWTILPETIKQLLTRFWVEGTPEAFKLRAEWRSPQGIRHLWGRPMNLNELNTDLITRIVTDITDAVAKVQRFENPKRPVTAA